MPDFKNITEEELREGARLFEGFWLRPKQDLLTKVANTSVLW